MLGYGIAGKAFARILNQTHDEIMKKCDEYARLYNTQADRSPKGGTADEL